MRFAEYVEKQLEEGKERGFKTRMPLLERNSKKNIGFPPTG